MVRAQPPQRLPRHTLSGILQVRGLKGKSERTEISQIPSCRALAGQCGRGGRESTETSKTSSCKGTNRSEWLMRNVRHAKLKVRHVF